VSDFDAGDVNEMIVATSAKPRRRHA